MTWIPTQPDHTAWGVEPQWDYPRQTSITVYAMKENKRPVGFAPWPKKRKKKGKR